MHGSFSTLGASLVQRPLGCRCWFAACCVALVTNSGSNAPTLAPTWTPLQVKSPSRLEVKP